MPGPLNFCEGPQLGTALVSPNKSNIDSKGKVLVVCQILVILIILVISFSLPCFLAVVDALKTLQQKIRKLEVERLQAHKNYLDISQNIQPAATTQPETENCSRKGK